jgi:hypothetical protein
VLRPLDGRQRPVIVAQVENDVHILEHEAADMIGECIFEADRCCDAHTLMLIHHSLVAKRPVGDTKCLKMLIQPGKLLLVQGKIFGKGYETYLVVVTIDLPI